MKIIWVILFLITVLINVFLLYAKEINRKLNIKKRQMAIIPAPNKYKTIGTISVICMFIFGGLFIYESLNKDYDAIKKFDSIDEYQNLLSYGDPDYVSLSNDSLQYFYSNQVVDDNQNIYYASDNKIVKVDSLTKKAAVEVILNNDYQCEYKLFEYNDILICISIEKENPLFHISFYEKEGLTFKTRVDCDGTINNAYIKDDYLNLIIENEAIDDPSLLGINSTGGAKKFFDDINYIDCCSFDKILTHVKLGLKTRFLQKRSICLADYFMLYYENYIYIFCNCYKGKKSENSSFVLKYDINTMLVSEYKELVGIIYTTPIINTNSIQYLIYNLESDEYHSVSIDFDLTIKRTEKVEINSNNENSKTDNTTDALVFNNKVIKLNNIVFFNNKVAFSYSFNGEDKKIILDKYDLCTNEKETFEIITDVSFSSFNIKEYKYIDNTIQIIFDVDDCEGYLKITENDVLNQIKIENKGNYYFTDNYLILINNNSCKEVVKTN